MQSHMTTRILTGFILMVLGILFLLDNYGIMTLPEFIYSWEYLFILFGLMIFFLTRSKTAGLIFIGIGLFKIAPELWPLLLILLGVYILFRQGGKSNYHFGKKHRPHKSEQGGVKSEEESGTIEEVSVFGGSSKNYYIDNFRGGNIVSIFGGSEINLTNCKLAEGDNTLDITIIFGGATLIVPPGWKIVVDVLPIFGGFSDSRKKIPDSDFDEDKILYIKGIIIFGGGEIKN
ncbi:putative transmembrane protein [Melioribacter roseus P3M-2]|uniref:Putative transmembrane protein n=1 Tax=Melioribacter roseus (strain DSM 23840 / JCM 17771 / VKM B-2668 / P3M-2) TaxID=1191523 RepID=I6Z378_MELRP|nr:LiaF domain-containing protein [Melioribacter roseus]AFN73605.1 putative transmembrane protein [Melioribacter roseus P3M-2]